MKTETIPKGKFQDIDIGKLTESSYNPRGAFDAVKLAELAESIRQLGIQQALVVRPKNGKMEIVAGARRYRAAKLAKLTSVPVNVVTLTDEQAREVQIIENLQREDIGPLEEADSFRLLMKHSKLSAVQIGEKIGMKKGYVWSRLKLGSLIEPAKTALRNGSIEAGHAVMIARLTGPMQKKALDACRFTVGMSEAAGRFESSMSVSALGKWIQRAVYCSTKAAPFNPTSETLVRSAGSCTMCPKRAGNQPSLPVGAKPDTCLDRPCYEKKIDAEILRKRKELLKKKVPAVLISKDWYGTNNAILNTNTYEKAGRKKCKNIAQGIYVDGPKIGTVITVCTKGQQCVEHHPKTASGTKKPSKAQREKAHKEREEKQVEEATRTWIVKAAINKGKTSMPLEDWRQLAIKCYDRIWNDSKRYIVKFLGWADTSTKTAGKKLAEMRSVDQVVQFMQSIYLIPEINHPGGGSDAVKIAAKRYKISWPKVRHQVKKMLAVEKRKALAARKAKAAKKKGKKGKGKK